jgi:hypothetical protein
MNNETLMELKMMISGGFHNFFDILVSRAKRRANQNIFNSKLKTQMENV